MAEQKKGSEAPSKRGEYRQGEPRREKSAQGERPNRRPANTADKFSEVLTGGAPRGAAGALIELDKEIMKLLVRRATLVSRIRGGKDHAATPQAILEEKGVRMAWEANALSFSKDPKFTRQLFSLLQDVKVLTKDEADAKTSFALAPSHSPLTASITGPVHGEVAQLWAALAVTSGQEVSLSPVLLATALMDAVKAFTHAGASLAWHATGAALGTVETKTAPPLALAGKTIYVGDAPLTLYLLCFIAAGSVGVNRFTGGTTLKSADLSSLRGLMPLMGARLAHVMPRSQGLPATLECSGVLPHSLLVPEHTPFEAVCALLLAPLFWQRACTLDLSALPAAVAANALSLVTPLHHAVKAQVENHGARLTFTPAPLSFPAAPALPLDPALSAYLLAMPAFCGGTMELKGHWPSHMPEAHAVVQMLQSVGLHVKETPGSIATEAGNKLFALPVFGDDLSAPLWPLYYALTARQQQMQKAPVPIKLEDDDPAFVLQEFYARLGLEVAEGVLTRSVVDPAAPDAAHTRGTAPWTAPDAYWAMGLSLAAFIRPGLRLANPGIVTELMPPYWQIVNSLPTPFDPAAPPRPVKKEDADARPARRRIIAD